MKNHWVREKYASGEVIFKEGDIGQDAYLIEHGKVSITSGRGGQERVLATIERGEMFGEIALIDKMTRTASAIAAEDATLIRISRDLVVSKLKSADPLLSHILQIIVDRYREALGAPKRTGESTQEDGLHKLREYAVNQIKIAQNLSDALNNNEFELHYQPVVYLEDGRLGGFEALIRWNQPNVGFISPLGFIGVAEDSGLIVPIGRWVLKTALAALTEFQAAMDHHHPDHAPLFMSINVSARQLQEFGEIDELCALIRDSGIAPERIKLEVTESALIQHPETAVLALRQLKELGVLLAIDDFGTGYSSLSYLSMFPLDTLKIDQSFVFTLQENEGSLRITRAIAGLARDLGMNCIAEGIENAGDIAILRNMDCEYGQGYHFSKPRPHTSVLEYIQLRGAGQAARQ
jgi:EAL domain-containing protein (putative c-di-GMP-specific phosphodiesterase class I)